jgi:hypothetical protein
MEAIITAMLPLVAYMILGASTGYGRKDVVTPESAFPYWMEVSLKLHMYPRPVNIKEGLKRCE